ncbi:MAG: GAF domain-containing protein [Ardenticatenaceae bacterium]|nr:GAF domain-containing protein [Ardenticatenaceae bacterium]
MLAQIKAFLAPPTFGDDEDKNRRAAQANVILLTSFFVVLILYLLRIAPNFPQRVGAQANLVILAILLTTGILSWALRRGYVRASSYILVIITWSALAFQAWSADGVRDSAFVLLLVPILIASLLLGWRTAAVFTALSILTGWGYVAAENAGYIVWDLDSNTGIAQEYTVLFIMAAVLIYLIISNLEKALENTRQSNRELKTLSEQLEQRILERTHELQQAAAELKVGEERFALAAEGTQSGIWDWDLHTDTVYYSPRWQILLGIAPGTVSNQHSEFEQRLHPEDYDRVTQAITDYLAGQLDEYNLEFRMQHENGSYIWVQDSGHLSYDEAGKPTRMVGALNDVSQRKEVEAQLVQEQQRVRAILESISIPLLISRLADGVMLYFNDAISVITGLSGTDLIGRATPDFYYDPAERTMYLQVLQSQGYVDNYELQLKRGNGEPFWALVSARIIDFEGEQSVITSLIDITARQEAQTAIAKRASELATVAQVGTAASTILDPDDLLQEVVDLTKVSFSLYHAHIYLLDKEGENLVLTAGAGDVGRQMVAQGRQIPFNQEQSLVARAARTGQGVTVNDVQADSGFLPNPLLPNTHSEMAIPIMVGGLLLGVLDVQSEEVGAFTQEDINIYTTLAAQIAVALQNARQHENTQKALAETGVLLDIAQVTSSSLELESILAKVLEEILTATGFEAGLISLINRDTESLEILSHRLPERFFYLLQQNGLNGTLCHLVYQRQEPIVVLDLTKGAPVDVTGLVGLGFQSYQGVPLQVRGEVLGTICIFSNAPLAEQKANINLLQGIGQQVGFAIQNASLFEQMQQALTEVETFRLLVEGATQGIGLATPVGQFTYINPALSKILEGESAEDIIGNGFMTYHAPELQEIFQSEIQPIMRDTGSWQGESELTLPSGRVIPSQENYFFLFNEAGEISNVAVIIADISERKAAEAAQHAAQQAQEELTTQLGERLQQLNALQRAMTREGWQAFLLERERLIQGYQFNEDRVRMITRLEYPQDDEGEEQNLPLSAKQVAEIVTSPEGSAIGTKMQLHGETIGYIGVRNPAGRPIDPAVQALLQEISQQVSDSLERARLFEETELARSQTEALFSGSEQIVRATTLETILQALVEGTALRRFDRVSLNLFNRPWQQTEPPETVTVMAVWRKEQITPATIPAGTTFPIRQYPLFAMLRRDQALIVDDAMTDPRLDTQSRILFVNNLNARTMMATPMVSGDQWIGFALGMADEPVHLNEDDLRQVDALVGQAATVTQTLRLYQEAETRARREQLLREVGERVSAAVDAESVLKTASREIGRALGLQTYVYLKPPSDKQPATVDENGNESS